MKKKIFLRLVLTSIFIHSAFFLLSAQETDRNLVQVKYTLNYFKGDKPSFGYGLVYPDIVYKRFLKHKQQFLEFEFDNLSVTYRGHKIKQATIGKPFFRDQYIFNGNFGAYLIVTPKVKVMAKAGLAYRVGNEAQIANIYVHYQGTPYEIVEFDIENYSMQSPGVQTSCELMYRLNHRWLLSLDAGAQRFFLRKDPVVKEQFWGALGIGYAF